jgi:DnaJ-class molecular chaperone
MIKKERPLRHDEERTQGPLTMLCPDCKGEGIEDRPPLRKCHRCKGAGRIPVKENADE